eukprot:scaffold206955_cov13-Tisochrysis_lutea.AAC.1
MGVASGLALDRFCFCKRHRDVTISTVSLNPYGLAGALGAQSLEPGEKGCSLHAEYGVNRPPSRGRNMQKY